MPYIIDWHFIPSMVEQELNEGGVTRERLRQIAAMLRQMPKPTARANQLHARCLMLLGE